MALKKLDLAKIDKKAKRYIDIKYVAKALFISKNLVSDEEVRDRFKKVEEFYKELRSIKDLGKDRDLLLSHLGGYYRELQNKKAIDSGFEKAKKIIKIVESYVK